MATIRDRGVTTISVCKDTKQKLIALADGASLYEYIDTLVEKEAQNKAPHFGSPEFRKGWPPVNNQLTEAIETNFKYMFAVMYGVAGGEEFKQALTLPISAFYEWVRGKADKVKNENQGKLSIA